MSIDMCSDMCTDMYTDTSLDMCIATVSEHVSTDVCLDMCMDMGISAIEMCSVGPTTHHRHCNATHAMPCVCGMHVACRTCAACMLHVTCLLLRRVIVGGQYVACLVSVTRVAWCMYVAHRT